MNWFRKVVEVEKVVEKVVERVVFGAPVAVTLYEARTEEEGYSCGTKFSVLKKVHGFYLSCADAFAAWPGKQVTERKGICIGGEYFILPDGIEPIKVTKPKRAKGKA